MRKYSCEYIEWLIWKEKIANKDKDDGERYPELVNVRPTKMSTRVIDK